ncbi:hypothetical protein [Pseudovibrio sp. Tun.PSC04-5.I4]|uniref:hypothetical protein n=1 Tax=Pseudovibrio sp. Tun.PSC04-5.I4 TaxID=1798213 RepID=UPI00088F1A46|nr:hypothetical protein [Pseudovibrio sp. Tun.PSC04-5.I4]SDR45324.1 hypothetical protein SAMN04515695_5545 [Pseudovibrio sp. Tun.PSC04-5.I4]
MSVISSSFSSVYSFSKTMNKSPKEATSTQAEKTKPAPEVASPTKKATDIPKSKAISEVASDARSALDARYKETGVTSSQYRNITGTFRRETFDALDFDRRTLFAIVSNEGGQFTTEEMSAADSAMDDQVRKAMYGEAPSLKPHAQSYRDAINFLDNEASPEEKASFEWAKARATAMTSYKMQTGRIDDDLKSDNPTVNLLLVAYEELFEAYNKDMHSRLEDMPSYANAQQQWKDESTFYGEYSINFVV